MCVIAFIAAVPLFVCSLTAAAGELPRAEPHEVKLSAEKLAELKPALQKLVDDGKMRGMPSPWLPGTARWRMSRRSAIAIWRARRR